MLRKVNAQDAQQIARPIMDALLQMLGLGGASVSGVQEDALMAIGTLVEGLYINKVIFFLFSSEIQQATTCKNRCFQVRLQVMFLYVWCLMSIYAIWVLNRFLFSLVKNTLAAGSNGCGPSLCMKKHIIVNYIYV